MSVEKKWFTVFRELTTAEYVLVKADTAADAVELARSKPTNEWERAYDNDVRGPVDEVHDENGNGVWP